MRPVPGGRRAALSAVVTAALLLACACHSSDGAQADPTGPASGTSSGPDGTSSGGGGGASADPVDATDHSMPAPGPRGPGLVAHADLLVTSGETIDPATVKAVRNTKGVFDVEQISLTQTVIQDQALTVAAVDPGTYRDFTNSNAASTDAVWARVADGELALKQQRKGKVPLDADGNLQLGSAADAPKVHVGAYTPQSPLIDAVVNPTWVKTLGMTPGNALLIHTAGTAPRAVRKPLQKLLGKEVSVQLVDVATRRGIDPGVTQVAVVTGSVADAVGVFRFTVLSGGHIAPDPAWVASHIATEQVPILGAVTCNRLIFPQLIAALNDVLAQGLADKIKPGEYAGCYYPRFIAGTTTLSNHAFGLALDINAIENQRGTAGHQDPAVVQIFEKWGFTWGGDWRYTDPMHFEMNRVVTPQVAARSSK